MLDAAVYDFIRRCCFKVFKGEEAEDLVQEVALKVWKANPPVKSTRSWLWTVIQNAKIDKSRKLSRERKYREFGELSIDGETIDNGWDYELCSYTGCRKYEDPPVEPDILDSIEAAFQVLPEKHRVSLQLCAEGYSYEEISKMTGTPKNTVRTRIFYAREKFIPAYNALQSVN